MGLIGSGGRSCGGKYWWEAKDQYQQSSSSFLALDNGKYVR